jgi:hypothetical protein
MRTASFVVAVALALASTHPAAAQVTQSRSAAPAAALVKMLTEKGLDAIAAPDPTEPGRFIAALLFPGTQLLVVSAKYPAPSAIQKLLAEKDYRSVYLDLQGAASMQGRFFVQDMQADGLMPSADHGGSFDIVYENGVTSTTFDGDWQAHKMTEQEYDSKYNAADQRYADMLTALAAQLGAAK